eukprot:s171_g36.t1
MFCILQLVCNWFSSGPSGPPFRRSPRLGRLWGFDVGKYGQNMKTATIDFFSRMFHSEPGDHPFGTHKTLKDVDGNFQCTATLWQCSSSCPLEGEGVQRRSVPHQTRGRGVSSLCILE